jgi:hypothetical protein
MKSDLRYLSLSAHLIPDICYRGHVKIERRNARQGLGIAAHRGIAITAHRIAGVRISGPVSPALRRGGACELSCHAR